MIRHVFDLLISVTLLLFFSFFLMKLLPGSPFDAEVALNPIVEESLNRTWGMDKSNLMQFSYFVQNVLKGDWGMSIRYPDQDIKGRFVESLRVTFKLGFWTLLISYICGVSLAFGAMRSASFFKVYQELSHVILALPTLFIAPLLIWFFCFYLDWLPVAFLESPLHYILPVFLLSLRPIVKIGQLFVSSMVEQERCEYVRTAKAKGLGRGQILYKHIAKNSLIPLLGYSPQVFMGIFSGAFVVEIIFGISGLGSEFIQAISERDTNMVVMVVVYLGLLWMALAKAFDVLIAWVDPRVRTK